MRSRGGRGIDRMLQKFSAVSKVSSVEPTHPGAIGEGPPSNAFNASNVKNAANVLNIDNFSCQLFYFCMVFVDSVKNVLNVDNVKNMCRSHIKRYMFYIICIYLFNILFIIFRLFLYK